MLSTSTLPLSLNPAEIRPIATATAATATAEAFYVNLIHRPRDPGGRANPIRLGAN